MCLFPSLNTYVKCPKIRVTTLYRYNIKCCVQYIASTADYNGLQQGAKRGEQVRKLIRLQGSYRYKSQGKYLYPLYNLEYTLQLFMFSNFVILNTFVKLQMNIYFRDFVQDYSFFCVLILWTS